MFTLTCIISIVKVGYLFEQPTVARASKKRLYSGGIPLVWSYDITSELLRFGITREQFSGCATDPGYSLETEYLHHFTHNSELVTSSVQNAEAFFIPHKTTCHYLECLILDRKDTHDCMYSAAEYIRAILKNIADTKIYRKRRGLNHFLALGHETIAEILYSDPELRNLTKFVSFMQVNSMLNVNFHPGNASFTDFSFLPHKDIAVPSVSNGTMLIKAASKMPWRQRRFSLYHRGSVKLDDMRYSRGARQRVWNASLARGDIFATEVPLANKALYIQEMSDSNSCLYSSGWTGWSGRLADIILAGCVPLILNDGIVLPFEEVLDWRGFSVKLLEAHIDELPSVLDDLRVNGEHYEKQLYQIISHLTYMRPAVQGDAIFTALTLLKKRLWLHEPMAEWGGGQD